MTPSRTAEPDRPAAGLAGEQDGGGDGAGAGHQRDREREGGDVADVLLDGLLGCLATARSMRSPNTISKAMANSRSPPAMRNAGSEMPSWRSSQSPISAAPIRMAPAISAGAQRDLAAEAAPAGRR